MILWCWTISKFSNYHFFSGTLRIFSFSKVPLSWLIKGVLRNLQGKFFLKLTFLTLFFFLPLCAMSSNLSIEGSSPDLSLTSVFLIGIVMNITSPAISDVRAGSNVIKDIKHEREQKGNTKRHVKEKLHGKDLFVIIVDCVIRMSKNTVCRLIRLMLKIALAWLIFLAGIHFFFLKLYIFAARTLQILLTTWETEAV